MAMKKAREVGLFRERMEFARQWVLLDFVASLPTVAEYTRVMKLKRGKESAVEYDSKGGDPLPDGA